MTDINECDTLNGGCQQICTNREGSFFCSCTDGYELQMDNIRCQGELAITIRCSESYQQIIISTSISEKYTVKYNKATFLCVRFIYANYASQVPVA